MPIKTMKNIFKKLSPSGYQIHSSTETAYLCGPMSGLPNNNEEAFMEAEANIRKTFGYEVYNPVTISKNLDERHQLNNMLPPTYAQYLAEDIRYMVYASRIIVLPGHEKSFGAKTELMIAAKAGKPIFKFEDHTRIYYCPKCYENLQNNTYWKGNNNHCYTCHTIVGFKLNKEQVNSLLFNSTEN